MQRKSTKQSRGPNKAEKDFQAWLKHQPCCITGLQPVEVHHCVGSTGKHNKQHIGHWFCLPMAEHIHKEYHAGTKPFKEKYGLQNQRWIKIISKYACETGVCAPDEIFYAITDCRK